MNKTLKHLSIASALVFLAACNSMWGSIQKFDVLQSFTLTADKADANDQFEKVTFQVGPQNTQAWLVKTFEKKKEMQVALVRTGDKKQFTLDRNENDLALKKTGSQDVQTPWEELWRSCTYSETYTVCDQQGHCSTYTVTRPGQELVRSRTAGSFDFYSVDVANKQGAQLAHLDVKMDNTRIQEQIVAACR